MSTSWTGLAPSMMKAPSAFRTRLSRKSSRMRAACARVKWLAREDTRGVAGPIHLPTFAPRRCFGSSNPLCSCLGALEKRQLAPRTVVLMLQLLELRLEVGLLLLVQGCTFLT